MSSTTHVRQGTMKTNVMTNRLMMRNPSKLPNQSLIFQSMRSHNYNCFYIWKVTEIFPFNVLEKHTK